MVTVKIIKAKYSTLWYNQFIGEVYEVEHNSIEFYGIKNLKKSNLTHLVKKNSEGLCIYKVDTIIITRKHKLEKIKSKINENNSNTL